MYEFTELKINTNYDLWAREAEIYTLESRNHNLNFWELKNKWILLIIDAALILQWEKEWLEKIISLDQKDIKTEKNKKKTPKMKSWSFIQELFYIMISSWNYIKIME